MGLTEKNWQISNYLLIFIPNAFSLYFIPIVIYYYIACPHTQSLISCPTNCTPTCQSPNPSGCVQSRDCSPSCGCPVGTVLDESTNECVTPNQCGQLILTDVSLKSTSVYQDAQIVQKEGVLLGNFYYNFFITTIKFFDS